MEQPVLFIIPGACSLGSQVALEWLKIPYQIGITTAEIRASKEFRAVNPTGTVGALRDGKLVIAENLAILLYLADKYPDSAIAPHVGTPLRAKLYQWLSYLSSTLHTGFRHNYYPDRFVDASYADKFRQSSLQKLLNILQYINDSFNAANLLISDKPTIVESQAYGLLRWMHRLHDGSPVADIAKFPQIQRFFARMQQEVAVHNALHLEAGEATKIVDSKFVGYFSFN